jgi:superoxide reductase
LSAKNISLEVKLFSRINKAKDLSNLSDLEKKHLPIISAPASVKAGEPFEITIEVGKLLAHPNEPAHHIQWIVLLNGSLTMAIVQLTPQLTPVMANPRVTLKITLEENAKLRVLERCNIHGEWENSKDVTVS